MKIQFVVLLLLGATCLAAEGGNRQRVACSTFPVVVLQSSDDQPASSIDEAAVRKSSADFVKAANARDAKASAALWAEGGEFTGGEETIRGRSNLEKMYAESFAATIKGQFTIATDSVRKLSANLIATDGVLHFQPADGSPGTNTKFTSLLVREGNNWLVASVKESNPRDAGVAKLADLGFLIGDWEGRRGDRDIRISYAWGDGEAFMQARFTVKEKGEIVASGIEILAKDPATQTLRSCHFDKSGTVGESTWTFEGKKWSIDAKGTHAQGDAMSATNILIPLSKDSFTWQSVERSVGGQPLPNLAPIKITRVKK
jgi:uncharacterized protein (TIGR02246 family)